MTTRAGPPPAPATPPRAPLDDVMLAMDVVDTLRQRRQLVDEEMREPERAEALIERLRAIYAAQGIEVPTEILAEGVTALREDRFVHQPAPPSTATTLARVYVSRGRWGPLVTALAAVAVLALGAYRAQVVGPRNALPGELRAAHAAALELTSEPAARQRADDLLASARVALGRRDVQSARAGLDELQALQATLAQAYTVRVVNRAGEASGVWRVPGLNPAARNYYLIVEAIGPDGQTVPVSVHNEETGSDELVRRWGLRVDEATFQAVARDKQDDGIIQADVVGTKRPGTLAPAYTVATTGAAITRW